MARLSHMGRDTTEDAEADRRAAAAIIALRECIGRRSREGDCDGRSSGERGEGLDHGSLNLIGAVGRAPNAVSLLSHPQRGGHTIVIRNLAEI